MKKVTLFIAVVAIAATFTSCKKDYTCDCKDSAGATVITYTATMKKKDATAWCDSWNSSVSAVGGKCTLK